MVYDDTHSRPNPWREDEVMRHSSTASFLRVISLTHSCSFVWPWGCYLLTSLSKHSLPLLPQNHRHMYTYNHTELFLHYHRRRFYAGAGAGAVAALSLAVSGVSLAASRREREGQDREREKEKDSGPEGWADKVRLASWHRLFCYIFSSHQLPPHLC